MWAETSLERGFHFLGAKFEIGRKQRHDLTSYSNRFSVVWLCHRNWEVKVAEGLIFLPLHIWTTALVLLISYWWNSEENWAQQLFYSERRKLQYLNMESDLSAELQDQFCTRNFSLAPNPRICAIYRLFYASWISKLCALQRPFILFCIMISPQYFPAQHLNLRITYSLVV